MASEQIMEVFKANRARLLEEPSNHGKYALVNDVEVVYLFHSFESAVAAGDELFGLRPFLVQLVVENEKPIFFPRDIGAPSRAMACRHTCAAPRSSFWNEDD